MKYLKGAGEVVVFLVGLAGLVYLLGGLVIGLRLLFAGFSFASVATIIGQLPRQLVVTTAMLEVALPAAVIGLVAVMITGVRLLWKPLEEAGTEAPKLMSVVRHVGLFLFAVLLMIPALVFLKGGWVRWGVGISGFLLTYTFASLSLPLLKRVDAEKKERPPIIHAATVFAFFVVAALVPSTLLASSLRFDEAQVCRTTTQGATVSEELVEGRLIGEGGGQVLLEQEGAGEQWVVNLPTSAITKSEYGDIRLRFACREPSTAEKKAELEREAKAEEEVGLHGGATERGLANKVRPYLFFDAKERWRPIAVDTFVDERFDHDRGHELCSGRPAKPNCEPLDRLAQLRPDAPVPTWIDIHGEGENGSGFEAADPLCHERLALDCNGGPGAAIYYRRSAHEGFWYWDFWIFYRYNDYQGKVNHCTFYCDDHEGDWEGLVVVTTESLEPEVTGAIYAAHTDRIYVPAATLPLVDGHPLAYVAKGTHATYPYVCDSGCEQYSGLFAAPFPEGDHGGQIAWDENAEAACATDRCVRALPPSPKPGKQRLPYAGAWAAWPGTWGSTCPQGGCSGEGSSPHSPGLQARFKCPWVANLKAVPEGRAGVPDGARRYGGWKREQAACIAERARG
jgi:hypothetical protein